MVMWPSLNAVTVMFWWETHHLPVSATKRGVQNRHNAVSRVIYERNLLRC